MNQVWRVTGLSVNDYKLRGRIQLRKCLNSRDSVKTGF